jgi:hypothetical protein
MNFVLKALIGLNKWRKKLIEEKEAEKSMAARVEQTLSLTN